MTSQSFLLNSPSGHLTGRKMMKITKQDNQCVLNDNGLIVVFEKVEMHDSFFIVLKSKVTAIDGKGNWFSAQTGVVTLFDDKMREALSIMHDLGVKVEVV